MPKKYSNQETLRDLNEALKNIDNLYNEDCINRTGRTFEDIYYTELIAKELLKNFKKFNNISKITRKKTYCRKNHQKIVIDLAKKSKNDYEKNFAKRMTGLTFDKIGIVLDYQVPLKDKQKNQTKNTGEIDLISYNNNTKTLYLIELKYYNNDETLLRAILESYTYYKTIDIDKLKKNCTETEQIKEETVIIPAVLVTPKCNAYVELEQLNAGCRPYLKKLASKLGVRLFKLDYQVN